MPFASWPSVAVQLHHSGHSFVVQHSREVKVGRADLAAFRCTCLIAAAPAKAPVEKGRKQSIAAIRKKVPFVPAEGSDRVGSEDE